MTADPGVAGPAPGREWLERRVAIVYLAQMAILDFAAMLAFTIGAVYAVRDAGLDALELVLLGTALEAAVLVFEVPTGIVADIYGRKRSIVFGIALFGASFVLWGSVPVFISMVVASVGWGIGYTFRSGALQAWLTDEVGVVKANRLFLRGSQAGIVGALVGAVLSVLIAPVGLGLPIVIGGLVSIGLALAMALVMPETRFERRSGSERERPHREAARTLRDALRLVRRTPVVLTIVAISVVAGAGSEALDRLWELHFLDHFAFPTLGSLDSVTWFGIMNVGSLLIGLVAVEVARRTVDASSHGAVARTLFILQAVLIGALVAFALAGDFVFALGAFWTYFLVRDLGDPLTDAWLNQSLEPKSRATVFSVAEQAHALGELVGGPIMGAIALATSTRGAILAAAAVLLPSLWLYRRALGQGPEPGVHDASEVDDASGTPADDDAPPAPTP